jgi:hypothetical protein
LFSLSYVFEFTPFLSSSRSRLILPPRFFAPNSCCHLASTLPSFTEPTPPSSSFSLYPFPACV